MKIIRFVTEKNDGLRIILFGPKRRKYELFGHFRHAFFCTHLVFVIMFSNLKLIILEDQGKYWHILLHSTLIRLNIFY